MEEWYQLESTHHHFILHIRLEREVQMTLSIKNTRGLIPILWTTQHCSTLSITQSPDSSYSPSYDILIPVEWEKFKQRDRLGYLLLYCNTINNIDATETT